MTLNVAIPGLDRGFADLLSFHAVADYDGHVVFAVSIKRDDGTVNTYRVRLPADRAAGYAYKAHIAVNQALMSAPRPKQ